MAQLFSTRSNTIIKPFLDLVFPPICFVCSERISDRDPFLCSKCRKELIPETDMVCSICGSFNTFGKQDCQFCQTETLYFDKCVSIFPYNDVVRTLIHELKYKEMTRIASYFTEQAIFFIETEIPFSSIDYVCPVPLHRTRQRERGFNQAAIIAQQLAKHFDWKYYPKLIKRAKFTFSQSNLSPEMRKLNVETAFSVDKKSELENLDFLIIDDIFTTGATVNAICRMLREHNVNRVFVMTIARA